MHSMLDSISWSIFGWFSLSFSILESQLNTSLLAFSWFSASKVNIDFWSHFGTNLVGFWYPKSTKIHPKIDSKRHQKNDAFLHRFLRHLGCNLGPKLGPCWLLFSAPGGGAVKCYPLLCCVAFFNRFFFDFLPPGPMGYPICGLQGPIGYPIFARFLDPIWCQLGAILGHFGARAALGWAKCNRYYYRFYRSVCYKRWRTGRNLGHIRKHVAATRALVVISFCYLEFWFSN